MTLHSLAGHVKQAVVVMGVLLGTQAAEASLVNNFQFNGKGNWSLDAVGSNSTPVGNIDAIVPLGSFVEKAFLYSSLFSSAASPTVTFDGTVYAPASFTPLGVTVGLQAWRADVTTQVRTKIGGGSALPFTFSIDAESPNGTIDGEVLAIVYSNPAEVERTIAFLDGFSATTGDTTTFNFSSPLIDPTTPGFEAQMSLGIGFGFQPAGQFSRVDVDGRRLTSSAGGQDDGGGFNGGLITVGGIGDSPLNPVDPNVTDGGGPRTDDELYNLALGNGVNSAPFLTTGATSFKVDTINPSNNDNIFFLGLNVTARGGVNQPPPPPDDHAPVIPEPSSMLLCGLGVLSAGFVKRFKSRSVV